ncbi:MAG: acyl-CoA thioesterase [Bacteroidales bacterium]|nr:acyl-CoA thioesterase [Bacteroidales bacterium]
MYLHESEIRVRYSETDKMAVVYHGNYAQYLEHGRSEALRDLGITYKDVEADGIIMPVVQISMKYYRPAKYDELLTVKTLMRKMPGYKIDFEYEIINESGELLTLGKTMLVFINHESGKPVKAPTYLTEKLLPFFEKPDMG